ncbi:hypothetical protein SAMN05660776_1629 [Salegentibacter holothuriorum]|uniref:Lipoprotein n=1 Tax=Salegentibacter holothuriorum TaxID=241145 RepID=A0A1T5BZ17_9FLAO|nr:hypothetical protein [Salegentibacter holothuriorum]SKB52414.1 hypothetical protein SAMN05660776_1629 [Salegentibacter holothuriorum]
MKRLILLFVSALVLVSCDTDDGPNIAYDIALISDADLPEYFDKDETYDINVDYALKSACHTFVGFDGNQGKSEENDSIFEYNITVISSYDPALTECTIESESLSRSSQLFKDFQVKSEDYTTYRFNLLSGFDSDDKPEYITIDVPVGEPEPETPEENTNV